MKDHKALRASRAMFVTNRDLDTTLVNGFLKPESFIRIVSEDLTR